MLRRLRMKWGLLVAGSTAMALGGFGQCIADFIEDAFIFRAVN